MCRSILILDTGKEWGGGTNSLFELLKRMDRSKFRFTALFYHNVVKPQETDIKTEMEKLGMDFLVFDRTGAHIIIRILKELGRIFLFFSRRLRKYYIFLIDYFSRIRPDADHIVQVIQKLNVDLIYMNNQPSSNLEGIIAAKKAGIKSLLHSRIETDLNRYEIKAVNKWLTKMICVSDGIKESFVRNGIDNSKCIVVHNGIDTGLKPALKPVQIKQEYKIKEKELLIGAVGSLMKRKRFHDLIRAISYVRSQKSGVRDQELKNTTNKIKCIIVGEGPERESLQKEINKHGLQESVILAGFKPDAISYINAFDIFVLPSEREGFPRVLLEAMLMKKPVIASRIAGPSELVIDKETGFLFQKGNIKELASYIVTLLSLPQRRIYMGNRGRRHVVENFAIEKYIAQVNQVFSEVIE